MNIKDITNKPELASMIMKFPEKEYLFAVTDKINEYNDDYIFIPLNSVCPLSEIEKHLKKNKNCKGFFVKKMEFNKQEFIENYTRILRKYEEQIEFTGVDRNLFNTVAYIAKTKRVHYAPKVIAVCGSVGKTITTRILDDILGNESISSYYKGDRYELALEPLLLLSRHTKYCVCEISYKTRGISEEFSLYLEPSVVLFLKAAAHEVRNRCDYDTLGEEITGILKYAKRDCKVFSFEENEPLEGSMPLLNEGQLQFVSLSNIKNRIEDNKLVVEYEKDRYFSDNKEFYMPNCLTMAVLIAKYLGKNHDEIQWGINQFKKPRGLLECVNIGNGNTAVFNTLHHSPYPFENTLKAFCEKFPHSKKILVLSSALNLGDVFDSCTKNMIKSITNKGFSEVVFINLPDYGALFAKNNIQVYLKRFDNKSTNFTDRTLSDLRIYLDGLTDNNCAILFCVHPAFNVRDIYNDLEKTEEECYAL